MDKFYIITNSDKDKDFQITNEIVSYLKKNGKKCQVQQAERKLEGAFQREHSVFWFWAVMVHFFRLPEMLFTEKFQCWESILGRWGFWLK